MTILLLSSMVMFSAWLFQQSDEQERAHASLKRQLLDSEDRLARLSAIEQKDEMITVSSQAPQRDQVDIILDLLSMNALDDALTVYRENLVDLVMSESLSRAVLDALMRSERYIDAFDLMYEQRLFVTFEAESELLDHIHKEVRFVDEVLAENQDYPQLISLYQRLIQFEADYPPYYLRLAHWQWIVGEREAAEQSLIGARHDVRYQDQLTEIEGQILSGEVASPEGVAIPLIRRFGHYLVDALLEDQVRVSLMIDTGASMTVIKESVLAQVSEATRSAGEVELTTANGSAFGEQKILNRFRLGPEIMRDLDVVEMSLEGFEYDGLLGMNVLSQFEFYIDQEQSVLFLR